MIKVVRRSHRVCWDGCPNDLPDDAHKLWKAWELSGSDGAVVAQDKNKIIGFFRYNVVNKMLFAAGTWTNKEYRGQGIAVKMWKKALRHVKPIYVWVYVTSKGGKALANSIKRSTKIPFMIKTPHDKT